MRGLVITVEAALFILFSIIMVAGVVYAASRYLHSQSILELHAYTLSAYKFGDASELNLVDNVKVYCEGNPLHIDWISVVVVYPDGATTYKVSNGGKIFDNKRQVTVQAYATPQYICDARHGDVVSVYVKIVKAPSSRVRLDKTYIAEIMLGGAGWREWSLGLPVPAQQT